MVTSTPPKSPAGRGNCSHPLSIAKREGFVITKPQALHNATVRQHPSQCWRHAGSPRHQSIAVICLCEGAGGEAVVLQKLSQLPENTHEENRITAQPPHLYGKLLWGNLENQSL